MLKCDTNSAGIDPTVPFWKQIYTKKDHITGNSNKKIKLSLNT